MSTITDKKAAGRKFHIEQFESAMEVVDKAKSRKITDLSFHDKSKGHFGEWEGVGSYEEALELMTGGYQPTVDAMKGVFKISRNGQGKRFSFQNNIQGFAPVVPLALKGVPNSMIDMYMKPIKAKVVDVYYDMTASCGTDSDDIIRAGQSLLGAIIELEKQGYRFNLFACQTYSDKSSCDMLVVKVKNASQPLDLKRISFPLTHTGFFRVIGFDWYSRVPGGKYRGGYGHAIAYDLSEKQLKKAAEDLFGKNAIYFSAAKVLNKDKAHFENVLTGKGE